MWIFDHLTENLGALKRWRAFRHAAEPLTGFMPPISGSGQFTLAGLERIRNQASAQELVVVDLRQEPHLFADGVPISFWEAPYVLRARTFFNGEEWIETNLARGLQAAGRIRVHHTLKALNTPERPVSRSATLRPQNLCTERQLCDRLGLGYVRIPVEDHHPPDAKAVRAFFKLLEEYPEGTRFHVHCKGGAGRTTTFMAMADMFYNAGPVELDALVRRQHRMGGRDLFELPPEERWTFASAHKRKRFIEAFYHLMRTRNSENSQDCLEESLAALFGVGSIC